MKKYLATLVFPLALAFSAPAVAFAMVMDAPAPMPMSQIIAKLHAAGFGNIEDIEFEHGQYEATVFQQNGAKYELKINSQTGEILNKPTVNMGKITIQEAATAVEKAGYTHIKEIEGKRDYYEVKAMNAEGHKTTLEVNRETGAVTKHSWF